MPLRPKFQTSFQSRRLSVSQNRRLARRRYMLAGEGGEDFAGPLIIAKNALACAADSSILLSPRGIRPLCQAQEQVASAPRTGTAPVAYRFARGAVHGWSRSWTEKGSPCRAAPPLVRCASNRWRIA